MFKPERVIFEKGALDYPLGQVLYKQIKEQPKIEVIDSAATNRVKAHIPGENLNEQYRSGKKTLVVGIKKSLKFQSCKPSAHYQLPLVSGCMGQCEYCYLNTQLGDKPYVKAHVNVDEILGQAEKYIQERLPKITIFEGAATSDPVPVDPYTHSLAKAIEYFGNHEHARFRFVTKYTDVDHLLDLEHNGHTEIRFSINTDTIIKAHEHFTASAKARIEAAGKVASAGYPIGFLIAPIFYYDGWKEEYLEVLEMLKETLPKTLSRPVTFELITHRYTLRAKSRINEVFPENTLPMDESDRKFKYGQFGYGKYIYPKEVMDEVKHFFQEKIMALFPQSEIKYIV